MSLVVYKLYYLFLIRQVCHCHIGLICQQVPEYCTQLTETEVLNQAFNLLFAFDEIVALGYRESVNLAQVRKL